MNRQRRKRIDEVVALIGEARRMMEAIASDEREYVESMPENLQLSDKWADADTVAGELEDIVSSLDELVGHRARIGTVGDDDIFWFLHVPMIKRIRSRCNSILTGSRSLFPACVSENGRAPGRTALPTG